MRTHVTKACRLLILSRLEAAGLLEGLTYRDLGALLGCNRSTAYRAVKSLREAESMVPEVMAQARAKRESVPLADPPKAEQ